MSPDSTGSTEASLNLVDDQKDVVFFGDRLYALEKLSRTVVVSTFGLNRLSYNTSDWSFFYIPIVLNLLLDVFKTLSVLLLIVFDIIFEWISLKTELK